jgi:hypothetical protein
MATVPTNSDDLARVRKIRLCLKGVRDCSNAGIAAGVAALAVLVGGLALPASVVGVLEAFGGVIFLAAALFRLRARQLAGNPPSRITVANWLLPCVLLILFGIATVSFASGTVKPYTSLWWVLVVGGLALAAGFAAVRRKVEVALEDVTPLTP